MNSEVGCRVAHLKQKNTTSIYSDTVHTLSQHMFANVGINSTNIRDVGVQF